MKKNITHIELFAGCGGMSLGLESAGFELYFANELSPMAGETFAYNILQEDLRNKKSPNKTLWIKSQYSKKEIPNRLKENPFEAINGNFSDLKERTLLKNKLLIGDINELVSFFEENPKILNKLKSKNIDLISGGPPCQGFSLAGKREKNDHKNSLPLTFSKIAGMISPKSILLENVKGITSPFIEDGKKFFAWLEVSKAFALESYVPICMMINSKYFGVPQNRPRFILFAYRNDIFEKIFKNNSNNEILKTSKRFYELVKENQENIEEITIDDFILYDIEKNPELFDGFILPKISHFERDFITANEAIGDIRRTQIEYNINETKGKYANFLNEKFSTPFKETIIKNHEPRKHNLIIKSRFRFYQVIEQFQNGLKKGAIELFTGKKVSEDLIKNLLDEFSHHKLLFFDEKLSREISMTPKNIKEVERLIKMIPTKKHSQRALKEFEPAPAQLTIPDDICHYHSEHPRTLTVREMARFQSFPDWFVFKSKITTGGNMRKIEVPQYSQVGNAVPPLLAKALGDVIKNTLLLPN